MLPSPSTTMCAGVNCSRTLASICRRRRCSRGGTVARRIRIDLAHAAARHPGRDANAGGDQRRAPLKDSMLLVDCGEQICVTRDALRRAQEQVAAGLERVVENGQDVVLQLGVEIDQQIAARDQVHARERRIAHHAVRGEDAQVAHFLGEHVALRIRAEEALQPLRRRHCPASGRDNGPCEPRPARPRRCRWRTPAPSAGRRASSCARATAARSSRPPRPSRIPAPRRGSCRRRRRSRTGAE